MDIVVQMTLLSPSHFFALFFLRLENLLHVPLRRHISFNLPFNSGDAVQNEKDILNIQSKITIFLLFFSFYLSKNIYLGDTHYERLLLKKSWNDGRTGNETAI